MAAQQWAEVGEGPLTATLVDKAAPGRMQALEMQHPGLVEAVAPCLLTIDIEAPTRDGLAEPGPSLTEVRPSLVAVVLDDESTALATALYLNRHDRRPDGPGGGAHPGRRDWARRSTWTTRRATHASRACGCSPCWTGPARPTVDGGVREQLARALYEDHLVRAAARGVVDSGVVGAHSRRRTGGGS